MIKIALLLSTLLSTIVIAGVPVEVPPAPTLPVYGQTIGVPARATYISDCVGISQAGKAACNTYYTWRSAVGRFRPPQYRYLATTYDVSTGAVVALRPLPGDTDSVIDGMTPQGRAWGHSMINTHIPRIVDWDAAGVPTLLGDGIAVAADDTGRHAIGNQICDAVECVVQPNVYRIYAMSDTDYVASYVIADPEGVEHVSMCRASDYAAAVDPEDLCSEFYLSEFGVEPTRVAINAIGTVVYHNIYWPTTLGMIALTGQTLQEFDFYWNIPLSGVNELGESVGGDKVVLSDGTIVTLPLGAFSRLDSRSINDAGTVVGQGVKGTAWDAPRRAFVYLP